MSGAVWIAAPSAVGLRFYGSAMCRLVPAVLSGTVSIGPGWAWLFYIYFWKMGTFLQCVVPALSAFGVHFGRVPPLVAAAGYWSSFGGDHEFGEFLYRPAFGLAFAGADSLNPPLASAAS